MQTRRLQRITGVMNDLETSSHTHSNLHLPCYPSPPGFLSLLQPLSQLFSKSLAHCSILNPHQAALGVSFFWLICNVRYFSAYLGGNPTLSVGGLHFLLSSWVVWTTHSIIGGRRGNHTLLSGWGNTFIPMWPGDRRLGIELPKK